MIQNTLESKTIRAHSVSPQGPPGLTGDLGQQGEAGPNVSVPALSITVVFFFILFFSNLHSFGSCGTVLSNYRRKG